MVLSGLTTVEAQQVQVIEEEERRRVAGRPATDRIILDSSTSGGGTGGGGLSLSETRRRSRGSTACCGCGGGTSNVKGALLWCTGCFILLLLIAMIILGILLASTAVLLFVVVRTGVSRTTAPAAVSSAGGPPPVLASPPPPDGEDDSSSSSSTTTACRTVSSFFNDDDEDWQLAGDGTMFLYHNNDDDDEFNNGRSIEGSDAQLGSGWYFRSPTKFHGDLVMLLLRPGDDDDCAFDLLQRAAPAVTTDPHFLRAVIVVNNDIQQLIGSPFSHHPGTTWTPYEITFTVGEWWFVGTYGDTTNYNALLYGEWQVGIDDVTIASDADIQSVLENVTDLLILGEYQEGHDTAGLDNVVLDCLSE
jgi:hypothetical protein